MVDRVRAVTVAGHAGDETAVRAAVDDPAGAVREAALSALVRLGPHDVEQRIDAALDDADPRVRARAAELATSQGVDPSRLLDDPDARVVEVACFACGEVPWEALGLEAPVGRLAETATGHDDALCRESAAAALGAIGDPRGLDAVLAACDDRVTVRRRATLALAAFDDPRADAMLERALDDKDWQVRQAAEDLLEVARTLGGDPDPDAYAD